ncbi:MAG: hypothetical protein ACE5G3_01955 [Gammaproteobacteria bacterium]
MSKIKHREVTFTNAETVRKRAWIEKALDSAKGRIADDEYGSESTEKSSKPSLYVVDSNRSR